MNSRDIQNILEDFDPKDAPAESELRDRRPVTVWLPKHDKERYDRLQKISGRQLSKKFRQVFQAVLDVVEKKVV